MADERARRPHLPGLRYVRHVLAVAEVYVRLVETARSGGLRLEAPVLIVEQILGAIWVRRG